MSTLEPSKLLRLEVLRTAWCVFILVMNVSEDVLLCRIKTSEYPPSFQRRWCKNAEPPRNPAGFVKVIVSAEVVVTPPVPDSIVPCGVIREFGDQPVQLRKDQLPVLLAFALALTVAPYASSCLPDVAAVIAAVI